MKKVYCAKMFILFNRPKIICIFIIASWFQYLFMWRYEGIYNDYPITTRHHLSQLVYIYLLCIQYYIHLGAI